MKQSVTINIFESEEERESIEELVVENLRVNPSNAQELLEEIGSHPFFASELPDLARMRLNRVLAALTGRHVLTFEYQSFPGDNPFRKGIYKVNQN